MTAIGALTPSANVSAISRPCLRAPGRCTLRQQPSAVALPRLLVAPRSAARYKAQAAQVQAQQQGSALGSELWRHFAETVSGEWEGVTATFDSQGEASELPDYYVPQAFKEWEVHLFDWQSQCSMLATDDGLSYKLRRLMPSVGCEADATAFVEEERLSLQTSEADAGEDKTVLADGCYSVGPRRLDSTVRLESCLYKAERQRIRMVHVLRRQADSQDWVVDSLELHHERYDSLHTGRQELAGCGGGMPVFATKERLTADEVAGSWTVQQRRAYSLTPGGAFQLSSTEPGPARRHDDAQGRVMLPLKAVSVVRGNGPDLLVAAAVLDEAGQLRVAARIYKDSQLQLVELTVETKEG